MTAAQGPQDAKTCRELLEMMPLGFNPAEAGDLKATIEFVVSGDEEFTLHLVVAGGKCQEVLHLLARADAGAGDLHAIVGQPFEHERHGLRHHGHSHDSGEVVHHAGDHGPDTV